MFESFVLAELVKNYLHRGEESNLHFWRDSTGHEVDVILEESAGLVAIEIKSAQTVASDFFKGLRFWRQLEDRGYYPRLELSGDEATVTNFRCQSSFVEGRTVPLKVTYCVRAYRKLEGLFDAYLSATSLVEDTRAL